MDLFESYLVMINIATFIVFAVDKQQAIHGKWRVSEASFFCLSLMGGALGGILAMEICRHKTKHLSFKIGLPLILCAQVALLIYIDSLLY